MYVHDLAVSRKHRGKELGPRLLNRAYRLAEIKRLEYLALVAVLGSANYWERQGFIVHHQLEYRPGIWASYMIKKLD
jgi:predicted N-acetyltransferase YhbS